MAGGEIIETDDALVELEQRLQKIGADEAGDAGDQPGPRALAQLGARFFIARSFNGSYRRRSD